MEDLDKLYSRLGKMEGMLGSVITNTTEVHQRLDSLILNHQKDKEVLNDKIGKLRETQATFTVWIKLVSIAIGSIIVTLVKKTFF